MSCPKNGKIARHAGKHPGGATGAGGGRGPRAVFGQRLRLRRSAGTGAGVWLHGPHPQSRGGSTRPQTQHPTQGAPPGCGADAQLAESVSSNSDSVVRQPVAIATLATGRRVVVPRVASCGGGMACRGAKGKRNRGAGAQLRRGARRCPSPKGRPGGARAEPCPTAEEFWFSPTPQGADARKAAITSLGVCQPRHLRGRSFRYRSIRRSSRVPMRANDERLGWSLRISSLVFSFVPRSQE